MPPVIVVRFVGVAAPDHTETQRRRGSGEGAEESELAEVANVPGVAVLHVTQFQLGCRAAVRRQLPGP